MYILKYTTKNSDIYKILENFKKKKDNNDIEINNKDNNNIGGIFDEKLAKIKVGDKRTEV